MEGDSARLTVIIPAFNEARRLALTARAFEEALDEGILYPDTTEVIVVDDGSTDETATKAQQLLGSKMPLLRVLRLRNNSGKGAAIKLGTAAATAPVVLFMDADMSVDPKQIPRLTSAIGQSDVAIGSRSLSESVVVAAGVQRKLMGRTFNTLVGALTEMPFRDTQCGFKAFRTPLARILFHLSTVQGFAFDVELLFLARRLGMEISEIAVSWREMGESRVRSLVDPLFMTRDVLGVGKRRERSTLPALAVTPDLHERRRSSSRIVGELNSALGPVFPILSHSDRGTLVLLPLCNPSEVQDVAADFEALRRS